MKRQPYKVVTRIAAIQETLASDHDTLVEAQEVVKHFNGHGYEALIYKWNVDDQRYLRMNLKDEQGQENK